SRCRNTGCVELIFDMSSSTLKCPECPYDKLRNLGTHLFFVHGYSKHRITAWRMSMKSATLSRVRDADGNCQIFRCGFCPKTYKRQNSCRAHERVVHCVTSSMRQKRVPCPIRSCKLSARHKRRNTLNSMYLPVYSSNLSVISTQDFPF
ncbi:hypothetical protein PENTCL1PPCAC_27749, partial [Pristionchus entomophagus]